MSELVGVRELGRRIGVSHVAVLHAIKDGRISPSSYKRDAKGRPRINLDAALRDWGLSTDADKNRNTEGKGGRAAAPPPKGQAAMFGAVDAGRPGPEVGMFGGKSVAQWRAAQLAIATKNEELDLQERQSKLADVAAIKAKWFQLVREARDRLLIIPDRLAGELAAESDQKRAHAIIDREIRAALAELTSDGQSGV